MNVRKLNGPLTHLQVCDILHLWHAARKAGVPFTLHITQRPPDVGGLDPAQWMEMLQATINAYCSYARRHKFPASYLWIREIFPDQTGEHFHLLVHVPARAYRSFKERAEVRRPFPEIKVTPAGERPRGLPDGRAYSSAMYIAKQMTPQAWYKFRVPRDLPLRCHPAAIRVSAGFTPSGAGVATDDRRSWSGLHSRSSVAVNLAA